MKAIIIQCCFDCHLAVPEETGSLRVICTSGAVEARNIDPVVFRLDMAGSYSDVPIPDWCPLENLEDELARADQLKRKANY